MSKIIKLNTHVFMLNSIKIKVDTKDSTSTRSNQEHDIEMARPYQVPE